MLSDVRQAWRSLRGSPGFALITIGTLALGIGVTVGMFSVLEGLLLRPLPFKDPERIVCIESSFVGVSTTLGELRAPPPRRYLRRTVCPSASATSAPWSEMLTTNV